MNYYIKHMNDEIVKQIISWKYESEYSIYNMDSYDILKQRNSSIVNADKRTNYLCFFKDNDLIGYTNISKKNHNEIFLGIGLSPKFCGKGLGQEILTQSIEEIKNRYKNVKIILKVRSWNKRAIKCYEKVGFKIIKEVNEADYNNIDTKFIVMEYKIN